MYEGAERKYYYIYSLPVQVLLNQVTQLSKKDQHLYASFHSHGNKLLTRLVCKLVDKRRCGELGRDGRERSNETRFQLNKLRNRIEDSRYFIAVIEPHSLDWKTHSLCKVHCCTLISFIAHNRSLAGWPAGCL